MWMCLWWTCLPLWVQPCPTCTFSQGGWGASENECVSPLTVMTQLQPRCPRIQRPGAGRRENPGSVGASTGEGAKAWKTREVWVGYYSSVPNPPQSAVWCQDERGVGKAGKSIGRLETACPPQSLANQEKEWSGYQKKGTDENQGCI